MGKAEKLKINVGDTIKPSISDKPDHVFRAPTWYCEAAKISIFCAEPSMRVDFEPWLVVRGPRI
jgi:hypothetical protein